MIQESIQKVIQLLNQTNLTQLDRSALVSAVLSKLNALPLNDSILIDQQTIQINGKALDTQAIVSFTESATALKDNWARKVLHEQVKYLAINMGVYKSVSLDELLFSKAALWCLAEENKLLDRLI